MLLFVASVVSLCPITAIASSPLLAQSAPAETEQPKNEKPSSNEEKISAEKVILGIVGGLAIFLFGVEQLARALKAVSGDKMKRLLARFTTNPFAGLVSGTVATTALDGHHHDDRDGPCRRSHLRSGSRDRPWCEHRNNHRRANHCFDVAKYAPAFLLVGLLVHFFGSGDRWKTGV